MSDDLVISRFLAAPREKLWRAWSDPKILAQWWCPKPWTTEVRAFEFYNGGAFHTFMRAPAGEPGESDNPGCFLDIVRLERIVSTSMLTGGWRPATPWIGVTSIITFAPERDGTRYVARVMHQNEEGKRQHEEFGFFEGWNTVITQLETLAQTL
jgi:uncharacterized protein YndB with AHSA1/START domain